MAVFLLSFGVSFLVLDFLFGQSTKRNCRKNNMDMSQLAITSLGAVSLLLAINNFEKNEKKNGFYFGIIGLCLIVFAGNFAIIVNTILN